MNTPAPSKLDKSKLISGSITALLAGGASSLSGQVTLGGAGFTVDNQTYLWDLDGNGHNDFQLKDYVDASYSNLHSQSIAGLEFSTGTGEKAQWMATSGTGNRISPFALNAFVSISQNFNSGAKITSNGALAANAVGFTDGGRSYVGFLFYIGTAKHYGWADITTNWGSTNSFVVHQWAWEATADTAIQIGATPSAVPEPAAAATGLGLLALGAAGLRRQRWLKRKAA